MARTWPRLAGAVVCAIPLLTVAPAAEAQLRPAGLLAGLESEGGGAVGPACSSDPGVPSAPGVAGTGLRSAPEPPTAALLAAGVAAGAIRLVGGAYTGAALWSGGNEYFPTGALVGGLAGEALLLPLGVHLANGRRGSLLNGTLLSLAAVGGGLLLAPPTGGMSLLAIPPVQLILTISEERR